jgi:hypothetical protein
MRGPSELISMVNRDECYLWVFPPTDHHATAPATHDRFFGEKTHPSAEMGMGFSIIDSGWTRPKYPLARQSQETFIQYSLSAPMWSWRAQSDTWRLGNILRSRILDGAPWHNEPLSDVLPEGLNPCRGSMGAKPAERCSSRNTAAIRMYPLSASAGMRAAPMTKTSHLLSIADFLSVAG